MLAAVLAFGLLSAVNKSKGKTAVVIAANANVSQCTQLTEQMLCEKEVGAFGLGEDILKDKTAAVGHFAACDIYAGEPIAAFKLSEFAADKKPDTVAAEGRCLVSVSAIAAGVGNHIKKGDRVGVMCYEDNKVTAFDELHDLEIYSVENADGSDAQDDTIAAGVTLIATPQQAQRLIYAEYAGRLHLIIERGVTK